MRAATEFFPRPIFKPSLCLSLQPVRATVVEVEAKLKTRKVRLATSGLGVCNRCLVYAELVALLCQAAAKRFKVTGTGKVMARHAGKQHFNEKMTRDEIRCVSMMGGG